VAVFWPLKNCEFVNYDDPEYVTSNDWIQRGLTLDGVIWAFGNAWSDNWHPLTWLSHMLDVSLFGSGATGPHLVNLLFHGCNAALVFLVLEQMTSSRWPSAFVAGLFAVHPLHVESVAWISERKDVLSSFFFLLSLWWYIRYARTAAVVTDTPPSTPPRSNWWRATFRSRLYWLAILFFALGLLCKPMLVTLPFLFLLLDYWPLNRIAEFPSGRRSFINLILEKVPFLALAGISCVVTLIVQKEGGAVHSLVTLPVSGRLANAGISYARYLGKMIWPVNLALPYPHPGHWPSHQSFAAALLVACLSWAAWLNRKRAPFVLAGWLWFLGMLVPVIGLVQVGMQAMADRYTYLPALGIFIIIAWTGARAWRALGLPAWLAALVATSVLLVLAARTRDQLRVWQNSETLFRHTLLVTSRNYDASINLGSFFDDENRLDEALEQYQQAMRSYPNDAVALNKIGSIFARKNDNERAIEYYRRAALANPAFSDPHSNLGVLFKKQGQPELAITEYREALRISSGNPEAHNNLANLLFSQGQVQEAVSHYRRAVAIFPRFAAALNNLAWALAQQGNYPEAVASCERAVNIKPQDASLRESFGELLLQLGRNDEARQQYAKAVELAPNSFDARLGLGRALARLGQRPLAANQLREALRLKPEDAEARKELEACATPAP